MVISKTICNFVTAVTVTAVTEVKEFGKNYGTNFLHFGFNYFDRHRSMLEIKNFAGLQNIIKMELNSKKLQRTSRIIIANPNI